MNIFLRLLPIILISLIFYLLINNLYPQYQNILNLVKKLNQLQNKYKDLIALEKLITALSQNANIQQLIANQEVLSLWLPQQPEIEEILASLIGLYQTNNLIFKGVDISIAEEAKQLNSNVLPVKIINLSFSAKLTPDNLISFIEGIEKNVRLMKITQANLSTESSDFKVESYYLSDK